MQNDRISQDTAELALSSGSAQQSRDQASIQIAATRLAQEAKQALFFGGRGVRDVTSDFVAASKALQPGRLVKDEFFTLFEAVGALEIMDPKMDSGVVPPGEPAEPSFDPAAPLTPGQTIWIMDELLCLENAWLQGYPLSQTVFASLHVDRLLDPDNRFPYTFFYGEPSRADDSDVGKNLTHRVLRAYCLATVKSVQMVMQLVQSQNYFEEEDFVTHLFGRELCPKIPLTDEGAPQMLEEAALWLDRSSIEKELKDALQVRLQTRRSYMLSIFGEADGWQVLGDLIRDSLARSRSLSTPVPEAFTDKVQRHLATSTPPRPVLETSWDEAMKDWTKLSADITEAIRLTSFWVRQSPQRLQRATWAFASRGPGTYARAVFQDLILADGKVAGEVSHYDLLLTDIRDLVLPGNQIADPDSYQVEPPSDPRHQCARLVEGFMDKILDEYLNFYRSICQNQSRIRRTFTQSIPILNEMETIIAAETDSLIYKAMPCKRLDTPYGKRVNLNSLTSWARHYKLKAMIETVQLGFETEIYLPDELSQMYWYLSQLASEQRKLLEHIEIFTRDRLSHVSRAREPRWHAECTASLEWLRSLKAQTETTFSLSSSLHNLYNVLQELQLIPSPLRAYSQPQLQYEARLKHYLVVTDPAPPSVSAFTAAKGLSEPVLVACDRIGNDLKAARTQLGTLKQFSAQAAKYVGTETRWSSEIKQLETSCVAATVGVSLIQRSMEKKASDGKAGLQSILEVTLPEVGKRYHPRWIVPQIKQKK